jgi:hypothetical protein
LAVSIAVSLPAAPIAIPTVLNASAGTFTRRQPWPRDHIPLKESPFYPICFPEVNSSYTFFDTQRYWPHNERFSLSPVSIINSILSACNCFIAVILSLYGVSQTDNTATPWPKLTTTLVLPLKQLSDNLFSVPPCRDISNEFKFAYKTVLSSQTKHLALAPFPMMLLNLLLCVVRILQLCLL